MPAPTLRPYQDDVIARVRTRVEAGQRRLIIVAPTGSGKTVISSKMVHDAERAGQRVLFIVHRRELIHQTNQKLFAMGIDAGIIAAGFNPRPLVPVQIAGVQSLYVRAIQSSTISLPAADLVVVDECHHATARTWRRIIDSYPEAAVIGLTATPCRGDGRGLGAIFQAMVECPSIEELIKSGFLVGTKVYAPNKPDLSKVKVTAGDYNEKQIAEIMDEAKITGDVVVHWHRHTGGRKTVVFATTVAHAAHLADEFNRAGVAAAFVSGETPTDERDTILAKLASGGLDVVVNCGVLTEGFDLPAIGCIVLARPTKSVALYRQMVGRGLRTAEGKDHVLVLDHAGCTLEHGFIDEPIEWTLAPDKRAERPVQKARAKGKAPKLADCPECSAVIWHGQGCKSCGWRPRIKPEGIEVIDGDLSLLGRGGLTPQQKATIVEQQRLYRELIYVADERGYQRGWAAHKYKERYRDWPPRNWGRLSPVAPSPETRSWIRSRQIAFFKARERERAAAS